MAFVATKILPPVLAERLASGEENTYLDLTEVPGHLFLKTPTNEGLVFLSKSALHRPRSATPTDHFVPVFIRVRSM